MSVMTPRQHQALMGELLKRVSPAIAQAFIAAITASSNKINIAALTAAIRSGNIGAVMEIARTSRALMFPMEEAVRAAFMAGAMSVAGQVPPRNPFDGSRLLVSFDGRHHRAETWLRANGEKMFDGILGGQTDVVRAIIADGIGINRPVNEIALDLVGRINRATGQREGGVLGLSSSQTDTLIGARTDLSSGEAWRLKHYLNLKSRDPAFDGLVEEAIRTGKKLDQATIDRILTKQKSRMLKQRGEVIARDQAFTAIDVGQHQGWEQLVDNGTFKAGDVTKRWQHNLNRPARPDHQAMSGTVKTLREPFLMGDGSLMQHTHDPAGGPGNNLFCYAPTTSIARLGLTKAMRHEYVGDLVELSFEADVTLSVTPNHPILTVRGWVAAGELAEGDHLFQCRSADIAALDGGHNVDDMEAPAEQIYTSAEAMGRNCRVPRGSVDFHGYKPAEDVYVVAVNRGLGFGLEPELQKAIDHGVFAFSDEAAGSLIAQRLRAHGGGEIANARTSDSSGFGSCPSLIETCQNGVSSQAIGDGQVREAFVIEASVDGSSARSDGLGNGEGRQPVMVKSLDLRVEGFALGSEMGDHGSRLGSGVPTVGRVNAKISKARSDHRNADTCLNGHLEDAIAATNDLHDDGVKRPSLFGPVVRLIAVVNVRRVHYRGPVYNFQSTSNILLAQGIVTHNCHCTTFYRLRKGRNDGT